MPQVPPFKDSYRERSDRKHGDCWRYLGDYIGVFGAYLGIVWGVTLRVDGGYMGFVNGITWSLGSVRRRRRSNDEDVGNWAI